MEKIVTCVVCGVRFDIARAGECEGHPPRAEMPERRAAIREGRFIGAYTREYCFECPFGHALHDLPEWWKLPVRAATDEEKRLGMEWVLEEGSPRKEEGGDRLLEADR